MTIKWEDIRRSPVPQPLSEEARQVQIERLARLNEFCEGLEPTPQLLELAYRYRQGAITFEEFQTIVRSW
jgi:hypothetical protein